MDIENLLKGNTNIYAHKRDGKKRDEYETLIDHSNLSVGYYYKIMEDKKLLEIFVKIFNDIFPVEVHIEVYRDLFFQLLKDVILLHDSGKINPRFQIKNMNNNYIVENKIKEYINVKDTEHSFLSSIIYIDSSLYKLENLKIENKDDRKKIEQFFRGIILVNAYVISRHHSDLTRIEDYIINFNEFELAYDVVNELKSRDDLFYLGPKYFVGDKNTTFLARGYDRLVKLINSVDKGLIYTYSRLLYSVLASSDYYATTEFMDKTSIKYFGNFEGLDKFVEVYESTPMIKNIRESKKGSDIFGEIPINILRTKMFLEAEHSLESAMDSDVFFLKAPTGSGKSNIAINLSFKLAKNNRGKIYYIYPFNNLIEQNMETLSKIFEGREDILNNISIVNSLTEIKINNTEKDYDFDIDYTKALLDRQFLNYPFVLMTHVSFFDILFGNKRSNLFSFLQLANSVVVIDEIQSYRIEIWAEIINMLKCYAKYLNIKILIMSATLPNLDLFTEESSSISLLPNFEEYFRNRLFMSRVEISYELLDKDADEDMLVNHILSQDKSKKILIELIKKDDAHSLYKRLLAQEGVENRVFCLTGDNNIIDRKRILNGVKLENKGLILVATQVIEAGIDIDMDIGYKNISRLDSEEQFLGRINRSSTKKGLVYLFELTAPNIIYKKDIRVNLKNSVKLEENRRLLSDKNFEQYYNKIIFQLKEDRTTSTNKIGLNHFLYREILACDYESVKNRMNLIEDNNRKKTYFFSRIIEDFNGDLIDGSCVWNEYKSLIMDKSMEYAEKIIKLSKIRSKMQYFIYELPNRVILYGNDIIGELIYIEDGEDYFFNGELNYDNFQEQLFL